MTVGFVFASPTHAQAPIKAHSKYSKLSARDYAFVLVAQNWQKRAEYSCLSKLWGKESAWNHRAANPSSSAYGIPQFLDSTWIAYGYPVRPKDAHTQVEAGLKYIKSRYGSPCKAWKTWQKRAKEGNPWY